MKNSSEYATQLKKLCKRVQKELGSPEEPELTDPTTEIVLSCLSAFTTESKAQSGLNKLNAHFVDFNELRVSRDIEVAKVLGSSFPQAKDAAKLIIQILQAIFDKEDALDLSHLPSTGKREVKAFLESMSALPAYTVARVMLKSIGGHAFPVHEKMLTVLQKEEIVSPDASMSDVQGFLERQIPSKTLQKTYIQLRQFTDQYKMSAAKKETAAKKKTTTKKKTATKKATKKKTAAKKTTKKKTTKKKTTKKKS